MRLLFFFSYPELILMRVLCVVGLLICCAIETLNAEEAYQVTAPKDWGGEQIKLPPRFAPQMNFQGLEEIRFAPGMFKPGADDFFSYAFLFWLPVDQKIDEATLKQELLTYYQGLYSAVATDRPEKADPQKFAVKLSPIVNKKPVMFQSHQLTQHTGSITWVEPFRTHKPQTLNMELRTWTCVESKHRCVFVCVSPQPTTAKIWLELRKIRDNVKCHAARTE